MKITNKNPRRIRKEESHKNTVIFRCKFCGQLQGCSPKEKLDKPLKNFASTNSFVPEDLVKLFPEFSPKVIENLQF